MPTRQVQSYAVNEGVEWMILTNGAAWQVWHLTGRLPVIVDLALEVDLLGTVRSVRKELRRQTSFNGDVAQLREVLAGEVIRAELMGK